MKRGDQIAYIPGHAKSTGLKHPDTEFGFVSSVSRLDSERIFCRYWLKNSLGTLRTTANSEATNTKDLELYKSVPNSTINEILKRIE